MPVTSFPISGDRARQLWLEAQGLTRDYPFGSGAEATAAAIRHLGYVQIDTINVIERCHHHILVTRTPDYRREHLPQAQSADKSVFEYWTHALVYVATSDLPFFLPAMKSYLTEGHGWFRGIPPGELRQVVRRIRDEGPLTIRDVDDEPVEKNHLWASRKPTKRVLELGFYTGALAISARSGMLKTYELFDRHFGWEQRPRAATTKAILTYRLDRALRSQGMVSIDSVAFGSTNLRAAIAELIEGRVRRKQLVPVHIKGHEKLQHWTIPERLERRPDEPADRVHILSPFDPLVIQRKRLKQFFGYEHVFEAYVPAAKRVFGYFALPVLLGDRIVSVVDLKTDRQAGRLRVQKRTDLQPLNAAEQASLDEALGRFERFQLAR